MIRPLFKGSTVYVIFFIVVLYSCSLHVFSTASNFRISFSDDVFTGSEDDPSMEVCVEVKEGQLGAESHIDVRLTTNTRAIISFDRFDAIALGKC